MLDTGLLRAYRETVLTFYSHKGFELYKASWRCAVGYDLNSQAWRKKKLTKKTTTQNNTQELLTAHLNPEVAGREEMAGTKIFTCS